MDHTRQLDYRSLDHSKHPTWLVLHGESSKRVAPPRNTKDRKHLQSTQSTVNQHTSQTKHQVLSNGQPGRRITPINTAAVHASAQQQPAIITLTQQGHQQIVSANAARCEAQEQYKGGLSRTTPKTPPASAGTRSALLLFKKIPNPG